MVKGGESVSARAVCDRASCGYGDLSQGVPGADKRRAGRGQVMDGKVRGGGDVAKGGVCVNTSCKVTLGPWQGQVDRNVLLCADGILPRVPLPARRHPTLAGYLYCCVGKEQQRLLVPAGFILPSHKHVYYATTPPLS